MINLIIDGNKITVDDGATILDAARKVGIDIPTLCNFRERYSRPLNTRTLESRTPNTRPLEARPLNPPQGDFENVNDQFLPFDSSSPPAGDLGGADRGVGAGEIEPPVSCFVCVVKIKGSDGFVPSCVTRVHEGMVVESSTEEVFKIRRQALELLLSHHNGDCEAPCMRICPCSIDIPDLLRTIMTGDYAGMISAVRVAMPFPAVLGYICSAPCEKGCRRKQVDTAVSIKKLHKFAALAAINSFKDSIPFVQPSTGKKVAIIGAGLAGLTVAYHLSSLGHACTVIEKHSRPGGPLNELGENILPADILDYEIDQIRKCGVTFQFDKKVTSLQELSGAFDATVIACGSQSIQWIEQQGIRCTERGVEVQKGTFATSVGGVFAIGGAIVPGKSASRTVGQSTAASLAIHRFLSGINDKTAIFDSIMGKLSPDDLQRFTEFIPSINRYGQVATCPGSPEQQAIPSAESEMAARCLQCDCGKKTGCDLRRYAAEYGAKQNTYKLDKPLKSERQIFQSGLVYEPGKCILCGRCVGITNAHRLNTRPLNPTSSGIPKGLPQGDLKTTDQTNHSSLQSPPAGDLGGAVPTVGAVHEGQDSECTDLGRTGLTFLNRGSDLYINSPFGEPMDQAMGDCMNRCIDACPTGALWRINYCDV